MSINLKKNFDCEPKIGVYKEFDQAGIDLNGNCFLALDMFPEQVKNKFVYEGFIVEMIVQDESTGNVKILQACYVESMNACLGIKDCFEIDTEEGEMLCQFNQSCIPVSSINLFGNVNIVTFMENVINTVAWWEYEKHKEPSVEKQFINLANKIKLEGTINEECISTISDYVATKKNVTISFYDDLNVRSINGLLYSEIHKHFKVRQIADISSSNFSNVISFISNIDVTEIAKIAKKVA